MKKLLSILLCLAILSGTVSVLADSYSDNVYNFTAVHSTATFDKQGELKFYIDEITGTKDAVLIFDSPVTMSLSGKSDSGILFDVSLIEYTDTVITFEPAFEKEVIFSKEQLAGNGNAITIDNGAYVLSLSTKDEKGSAVIILVGEQTVKEEGQASPETPTLPENAVISSWAITEFTEAYKLGLVTAELLSSNIYTRSITRSEYAHVMCAFLNECGISYDEYEKKVGDDPEYKFVDTNGDLKIEFVSSVGIITGTSENYFSPYEPLTREQAAVMLCRAYKVLKSKATVNTVPAFVDESLFSSWAKNEIYVIAGLTDKQNGLSVMGGVGDNYFSPQTPYTVEQALIATKRMLRAIK